MAIFLPAIERLYEYQREMNNHILDVAERVSWWDGSITGEAAFDREFPARDYPDISSLRSFWRAADSDVATFVESLVSDTDLERVYERLIPGGEKRRRILWEMMLHVINHGTQHRSEVAMMLTELGHSPGDMEDSLASNFRVVVVRMLNSARCLVRSSGQPRNSHPYSHGKQRRNSGLLKR